jgi:hypothetical protein
VLAPHFDLLGPDPDAVGTHVRRRKGRRGWDGVGDLPSGEH